MNPSSCRDGAFYTARTTTHTGPISTTSFLTSNNIILSHSHVPFIVVVGATGIQGGSVVRALLNVDGYTIRAITRNRQSEKAQALQAKGVEVVEADLNDVAALKTAFAGSHAIYAVTNFFDAYPTVGAEKAMDIEARLGTNLAIAAAATSSLQHYIWSTLPNTRRVSGGKIVVPHYEAKNRVDDYIKSQTALLQKTTFLWVPTYAQNIHYPFYTPFAIPTADPETLYQIQATPASVLWPMAGDSSVNVGLFVKAILDQPGKTLPGRFVRAVVETMTAGEVVQAWAAAQGKKGVVLQVSRETYHNMWPGWAELMDLSHTYYEMAKDKSFSAGAEQVLTKEDLGVTGLVTTAAFFAKK
ncbi:hypothetical protein LTR36_007972 [Oleoguttula mirabilis]|uniref:NmrA-like domain-containing protein n=1 Tax=Oleoguttula mirabilis TaxID=1507867 RepID=A0AAV9J8V3_9PEZI|nr:hypothetical protein LTR36_007972 [Oleoguttula mirabilis]